MLMKILTKMIHLVLFVSMLLGFSFLKADPSSFSLKENDIKKVEVYISPNGSDSHSGTRLSPVKSLEKAKELIRLARQNQKNSAITVFVEDGRLH